MDAEKILHILKTCVICVPSNLPSLPEQAIRAGAIANSQIQ